MLLMRLVTLSPYFFPSFLPRLLFSLQGSSVRSFEGEGRKFTLERCGDDVGTCGGTETHHQGKLQEWLLFFFEDFQERFYRLVEEEEACSMRGGHIL